MKLLDLLLFASDNLRRRKGRTILTVIGVVVGVCAIVVMISLGIAVNHATDNMLQNWSDLTKIEVQKYNAQQGTPNLDDDMVKQFSEIPNVIAVTPMAQPDGFYGQLYGGPNTRYRCDWIQLLGMDPSAIEPMGYKLVTGSYDISSNLGGNRIPVLVGDQVIFSFANTKKNSSSPDYMKYPQYDENYTSIINLPKYDENGTLQNPDQFFFDIMHAKLIYRMVIGTDSNGQDKIKEYELVPVGMISGGMNDWTISNGVVMSVENLNKMAVDYKKANGITTSRGGGSGNAIASNDGQGGTTTTVKGYDTVNVKVDDVKNMDAVEKAIKTIGYQIWSISETRRQMQGQVIQTQMMLGGLAAVSLFVAALNIMNTMTMAITERTREIGVMKVLGCKLGNIRRMFLIESGTIGLIGGIVGCIVSIGISLLLNNLSALLALIGLSGKIDIAGLFGLGGTGMTDMKLSVIPVWLILMALAFATVVGLLSGIAPANKAVRISSLEAIRHE